MVDLMDVYRSDHGSQVVGPGPLGAVSISHVDVAPVSSNHLRVASVFPLFVCKESVYAYDSKSIAGVPLRRDSADHPITAHHSYVSLTS